MVYVADSQYAAQQFNAVTRRNTLFTGITRSRAWVRVTGWGPGMETIASEASQVFDNEFRLEFRIPTAEDRARMRHIHRDRPAREEQLVRKAADALGGFLDAIERGDMSFYDLPPEIRTKLALTVQREVQDDDA
jgi:superfamily I DNA and RNA helicase